MLNLRKLNHFAVNNKEVVNLKIAQRRQLQRLVKVIKKYRSAVQLSVNCFCMYRQLHEWPQPPCSLSEMIIRSRASLCRISFFYVLAVAVLRQTDKPLQLRALLFAHPLARRHLAAELFVVLSTHIYALRTQTIIGFTARHGSGDGLDSQAATRSRTSRAYARMSMLCKAFGCQVTIYLLSPAPANATSCWLRRLRVP